MNAPANLLPLFYLLALFAGLFVTVRVCVADARRRGKSPLLVTLLVLACFPFGAIVWLLFRPAPLNGDGNDR